MSPFFLVAMALALAFASMFFSLLPAAVFLGIGGVLLSHLRRLRALQRTRPALTVAAARLDLSVRRSSFLFGAEASGVVSGLDVAVDQRAPRHRSAAFPPTVLSIRVRTRVELPGRIALFSRGADYGQGAFAWGLTFDDAFDRRFLVRGEQEEVAARLDASLRRRLIDLDAAAEMSAQGDELSLVIRRPIERSLSIVKLIEDAVAIASDLTSNGPSVPDRLLSNAIADPNVAVRYQNLDLLLATYPRAPQALEGLHAAWEARERGMRYLAAIRIGDDAFSFLAETVSMPAEPAKLRVMALRHLAAQFPPERTRPIVLLALKASAAPLREAAVELAGRLQIREALPALTTMGAPWKDASLRAQVAKALGEIGDPEAEAPLLALLDGEPIALKLAAIVALGRIGSARVLPRLWHLSGRYMSIRELVEAARNAAREIESRTIGRGELSLVAAGTTEGALSVAARAEGALSLSTRAESAFSLAAPAGEALRPPDGRSRPPGGA